MGFELCTTPIDTAVCAQGLSAAHSGGYVSFEGWVRDHHQGKSVSGLSYSAYPALAMSEGQRIIEQAHAHFAVDGIHCVHRTGDLEIGDCAVWVGVAAAHRDAAYAASRYVIDQIKSHVPIWKHEHYADGSSEWVGCAGCESHAHTEEGRYARQQALPGLGEAGQARLATSHVVIVGMGALGCPAASYLVGAGVGQVTLIDGDVVETSNLHRQTLYAESDVGQPKVLAAAARLAAMNTQVRITSKHQWAEASLLQCLLSEADMVLDCSDNAACKQLVSTHARAAGVPWIIAGVYRFAGGLYVAPEQPQEGVCWDCLNGQSEDDCNNAGVLGPVPGVLGSLQAAEAIKRLAGMTSQLAGHWWSLDMDAGQTQRLRAIARQDCDCSPTMLKEIEDPDPDMHWADLRDKNERAERPLAQADAVSATDLPSWLSNQTDVDAEYLLICSSGRRSAAAALAMSAQGHENIWSLRGGRTALPADPLCAI